MAATSSSLTFHAVPDSGEASGIGLGRGDGAGIDGRGYGARAASDPRSFRDEESPGSVGTGAVAAAHDDNDDGAIAGRYVPLETDGGSAAAAAAPSSPWISDERRLTLIQACYLSVFAVFGTLLRVVLAQLFGEECRNPGTVGWLAAAEPLCVTADGQSEFHGSGIVFADLPANLLGCFIMGFFLAGTALELPSDRLSVAWMRPSHPFQRHDVLHLAIRTGFCGSLTTFSSWNSEMVVMIYGTGQINARSQFIRAVCGYIIGVETAVGSFVFGKNVATWIFKWVNPDLAVEDVAADEARVRGVWFNTSLPDFERRYLADIDIGLATPHDVDAVAYLERWRASTADRRRVGDAHLDLLKNIEAEALVKENVPILPESRAAAVKVGWDVGALEAWVDGKKKRRLNGSSSAAVEENDDDGTRGGTPAHQSLAVALPLLIIIVSALAIGLALHNGDDAPSITYRTMWYSGLFAPPGALLRWHLSKYNGSLAGERWSWFPLGTLAANLGGSIVSITMISSELRLSSFGGFWVIGSLRAIKIGFAGSLSTVSTFVSEVTTHMKKPKQYRGYKYILVSLGLCCLSGIIIYGLIVYLI